MAPLNIVQARASKTHKDGLENCTVQFIPKEN